METKIPLISIFLAKSGGLSSKRVAGILGFTSCIIILFLGFYFKQEIDEFADYVLITSASLLGVDSISNIFTKGNRNS